MIPIYDEDDIPAVIIEFGSYLTRVGFVGEQDPRKIYRTSIDDPVERYKKVFHCDFYLNYLLKF